MCSDNCIVAKFKGCYQISCSINIVILFFCSRSGRWNGNFLVSDFLLEDLFWLHTKWCIRDEILRIMNDDWTSVDRLQEHLIIFRDHPYMRFAKFSDFWTPYPTLVRICYWSAVHNSPNLPYFIFFFGIPVLTSYLDGPSVPSNLCWENSLPVYVLLLPGQSTLRAVWLV